MLKFLTLLCLLQLWNGFISYGMDITRENSSIERLNLPKEQKLLIVSLDGFRWDYLQRLPRESNFSYFNSAGVHAPDGIKNVFITKTFPNHYALVTGLYEESHGVVGNQFFDPEYNEVINLLRPSSKKLSNLFLGEPIWASYILQNKVDRVTCVMWPGCEFTIKGIKLEHAFPYNKSMPFRERIDIVVDALQSNRSELAIVYFHEPDTTGHRYGPDSPQMTAMVKQLNDDLGYLLHKVEAIEMSRTLNLIVTSDHGMTAITQFVRPPYDPALYEVVVPYDCIWHVRPKPGKEQETVQFLNKNAKHYRAYLKQDLPRRWHYSNSNRILPVVVVADKGFVLKMPNDTDEIGAGTHGYDNGLADMRPIFMAAGPAFKSGYRVPKDTFTNLDVYSLMCNILGLRPAPNNGSMHREQSLLQAHATASCLQPFHCLSMLMLIVIMISVGL